MLAREDRVGIWASPGLIGDTPFNMTEHGIGPAQRLEAPEAKTIALVLAKKLGDAQLPRKRRQSAYWRWPVARQFCYDGSRSGDCNCIGDSPLLLTVRRPWRPPRIEQN